MPSETQTDTARSTLSSYLNDHLAGSKGAVQLVEKIRKEDEGSPLGALMGRLGAEIEADRDTLQALMLRLGVEPSRAKQAAGWTAEKLSRVRFAGTLTGSDATSRLMQLEALCLGVEGKRALWKALQQLPESAFGPESVDFDRLIARAGAQRDAVEPFRLQSAGEAFASA